MIGKGRKAGFRNKTQVERIVDAVVTAAGGSHDDTVAMLAAHYNTEQSRSERGENPVREEFAGGNELNDAYLRNYGMLEESVQASLKKLVDGSTDGNVPLATDF